MNYLTDLICFRLAGCAGAGDDLTNAPPPDPLRQCSGTVWETPLFQTRNLCSIPDNDECADLHWECVTAPDGEDRFFLLTRYAKDGTANQQLFSDQIYHLADPFPSLRVKAELLTAYMALDDPRQQMLLTFLTDPDCTRSFFHCICYLETYACAADRLDERNLRQAIAAFNSNFAAALDCTEVDPTKLTALLSIGNLRKALDLGEYRKKEDFSPWRTLLSACAIVHGCSIWTEEGRSIAETLLCSGIVPSGVLVTSLNRICNKETGNQLVTDLLNLHGSEDTREAAADLLFHLLQQFRHLSPRSVHKIIDALFRENITDQQVLGLDILSKGPNGDAFESYVTRSFFRSVDEGGHDFAYASAAIKTNILHRVGREVADNARNMILKATHPALVMQGLAILALYCRTQVNRLSTIRLGIQMHRPQLLHDQLLSWLRDPGSPYFSLACDAVEGLYLLYSFDTELLREEALIRAVCHAWQTDLHAPQARKILSLLPLDGRLPEVPDRKLLRRKAFGMYRYHSAEGYYPGIVLDFRLCVNLGCWNGAELRQHYCDLCIQIGRKKPEVDPMDLCHMQLLRYEIHRIFEKEEPCRATPGAALNAVMLGLSPSTVKRLNEMTEKAEANPTAVHPLTSAQEVLEVLEYIRMNYHNDPACTGDAAALLKSCRIRTEAIGSCVIVDWFEMLCCFGFTELALDFYRDHTALLNRPWCYMNAPLVDCDWTGVVTYRKFLENQPRLYKALGIALFLNHGDLVRAFLNTYPDLEVHPLVKSMLEEEDDDDLFGSLSFRDQNRSFWLGHLMERSCPEKLAGRWNRFYDDHGLTNLVLKHCPAYHNLILRLGYCDDEEAALIAVTARGGSLMFVSGRLKQNDDICTAALAKDSSVLHLIQAPMLQNRPLVKKLLMDSPLPLHRSPQWLCDDKEYVLKRVRRDGRQLAYTSDRLRLDPEVVAAAKAQPDREQETEPDHSWMYEDL